MDVARRLDESIRKVPGFPHEGILFYDITGILMDPEAFSLCIDEMVRIYKDSGINAIACIEARGFIFAAPCAKALALPLILVRKRGKLPGKTIERSFHLEYGQDIIQIQCSDVRSGDKILIVDDLIATGGTILAAAELLKEAGAEIQHIFGVIGLPFLKYEDVLSEYTVKTLIEYDAE